VCRGAEENAVRKGLARAGATRAVGVCVMGAGPPAALAAADAATADGAPARVLVAGLCGGLSPALDVGDVLLYHTIGDEAGSLAQTDDALTARLADLAGCVQTGIRAAAVSSVVTESAAKRALAQRCDADAVDMESLVVLERLTRAGSSVAVLRVVSDSVADDLPDLNAAIAPDGAVSGRALLTASLRKPGAALAMARNGVRALGALERAMSAVARECGIA
jgi:nucleoside phosphorylase